MNKPTVEMFRGDAIETLTRFADEGRTFDALVADPPYCSGGVTNAERKRAPSAKYYESALPDFSDNLDQFALWDFSRAWLVAARRVMKPRSYAFVFCDWRQLNVFSSAFQSAGFYWRGVVVWNKENARPNKGHFTPTCEFVLWGTSGAEKSDKYAKALVAAPYVKNGERVHASQKPTEVVEYLLKILPDDARSVVDPFAGSGTTGVAARNLGLDFAGVELIDFYFDEARRRLGIA